MVKGCQRKIIHVKDSGSKYYEEAYFLLKPGAGEDGGVEEDMIDEALKIAGESLYSVSGRKKARLAGTGGLAFLIGVLAGAAVCAAVFFFI